MALRATATALALSAAALAGCGGDGEGAQSTPVKPPAITAQAQLAEPAPKGSSLQLKELYRQFQPPEPNPRVKGSAKAIARGEEACEGKTPAQVAAAFIAGADLSEDQEGALGDLPRYEASPSASFPAGQIAALVYQRSLPGEVLSSYGFQGCVYALSLGAKEELAPKASPETGEGR